MEIYLTGHRRRVKRGTRTYLFLTVLIGAIVGFYSFDRYQIYMEAQNLLLRNTEIKSELQQQKTESESLYKAAQSETEGVYEKRQKALKDIFPREDDLTVLTRTLDKFFLENNYTTEPFLLESLTYGEEKTEPDWDYTILPITINAKGSRRNLEKFLTYIEQSGFSFSKTRLMSIQNLDMSFQEDEEKTGKKMIQFNAQMSAYFQKTP